MAQASEYISFLQLNIEVWVTRAIYSLAFYLLLPLVVVRVYWRSLREPRYRQDLRQRFGIVPASSADQLNPVWVHAVSAGETTAARELVERLITAGHSVIVSNMTPTGRDCAEQLFGDRITNVYAPYDMPHCVAAFLARVKPAALIIIDTELWPNMVALSRRSAVPVYLVNGRLSEKSARGYESATWLTGPMFEDLTQVFAQTETQAARFKALGSPSVLTTGSIKFDAKHPADFADRTSALREQLPVSKIILGASTHEGEEAILVEAFLKLENSDALLILAPRHTHRVKSVVELLEKFGLSFQKHSDNMRLDAGTRVYLLDTMGELIYFYGICQIAFVGGSLVDVGGHNPMEPGGLGKPILMGPFRRNIGDIAEQFADAGALITVSCVDDVYVQLNLLLNQPEARQRMGNAALEVMARNRGALDRVCDVLLPLLRENKR